MSKHPVAFVLVWENNDFEVQKGPRTLNPSFLSNHHHLTTHLEHNLAHLHPPTHLTQTATMQWLVTLYCAIMGAVQLYTNLPVGCDSRFSPLTSCNTFGHNLVTGSNKPLLLDAAPIRPPLYLSVAPTALDFVATPRTESVTSTSFDRVIYTIHPLSDDDDQSVRDSFHLLRSVVLTLLMLNHQRHPAIDIQAPEHPYTIASTLLPYIAMFLFAVLPRPHGGPSMVRLVYIVLAVS